MTNKGTDNGKSNCSNNCKCNNDRNRNDNDKCGGPSTARLTKCRESLRSG